MGYLPCCYCLGTPVRISHVEHTSVQTSHVAKSTGLGLTALKSLFLTSHAL